MYKIQPIFQSRWRLHSRHSL